MDTSRTEAAKKVKFIPAVSKDGNYEIYTYYPKLENGAEQTRIEVFDGKNKIEKVIIRSEVQVIGQTSGEWVSLGKYQLKRGNKAYVEISGAGDKGIVVADAILLVANK